MNQTSLEITINVTLKHRSDGPARIEIADWQFDIHPLARYRELNAADRAALWSTLRDEIEEFWMSTALEDDEQATWNYRLEDVDLD
jgi:hypothetical protein